MKYLFLLAFLAIVPCACAPSGKPSVTQIPTPPTAPTASSELPLPVKQTNEPRNLFDGKTTAGWKPSDFFGAGKIHVKDGALVIERGKIMSGITYTKGDFPKMDYEASFEGKKVEGNDFFATTTFPVGDSFCSLVIGGWSGTVVGLSSIDFADASTNETRSDREFKADQWYRFRIRVSEKRIEAWIDQEKVVDLDTTDRKISTRVECNASKPFGIATYETTGAVRQIQVRLLTDAEKKKIAETKPEKKE